MNIDVVFSGGGVKAFSFIGGLQSIEAKGLRIERVAGTSAGAMIASLVAANYTIDEIKKIAYDTELRQFLDPPKLSSIIPFSKWLFLYYRMGLNRGNHLEKWLYDILKAKNVITFQDLKKDYLKVIVSDLSLGRLIVIPDDLEEVYGINPRFFRVATAVRMSASFPYIFMPKKLQGHQKEKSIIVDGGLLSNFPMWVFDNSYERKKRPILGLKISQSENEPFNRHKIHHVIAMTEALFTTMKQAHDVRYLHEENMKNIITIPVCDVQTTDFHLDDSIKQELIESGKTHADRFLKYWPK